MISCIPMVSKCWYIRSLWRLKGDTFPLWAGENWQGQSEASLPEAHFSRSGCTDCPAVDHEWHAVERSVSREGMKGRAQLEKSVSCRMPNSSKTTLCNCRTTPQWCPHPVLLGFHARDCKQMKEFHARDRKRNKRGKKPNQEEFQLSKRSIAMQELLSSAYHWTQDEPEKNSPFHLPQKAPRIPLHPHCSPSPSFCY